MIKPYYQDEWVTQYYSDALKVLAELESGSIDLLATDPPYGLSSIVKRFGEDGSAPAKYGQDGAYARLSSGFMGKKWDVLPDTGIWRECLRVLKPGAFAFVMCIPRQDSLALMILRLQEAGFNVGFSPIYWAYASGFPKAQNIGKIVDKRSGAKRGRVMQEYSDMFGSYKKPVQHTSGIGQAFGDGEWEAGSDLIETTTPATPQAKALNGSYGGFQPKPAVEVIIVAMKPLSEKTFVDQVLKNKKGITWLDDGRIPYESKDQPNGCPPRSGTGVSGGWKDWKGATYLPSPQGRFPANLLVSDDVLDDGIVRESGAYKGEGSKSGGIWQKSTGQPASREYGDSGSFSRFFDLDKWWAKTFPFLIVPKASKSEKDKGLGEFSNEREVGSKYVGDKYPDGEQRPLNRFRNIHPTVKPLKLMSYLITLGSRAGDTVLDPFLGSGTTSLACKILNR